MVISGGTDPFISISFLLISSTFLSVKVVIAVLLGRITSASFTISVVFPAPADAKMILFDGGIDIARESYLFSCIEEFQSHVGLVRRRRHVFDQRIVGFVLLSEYTIEQVEAVGLEHLRFKGLVVFIVVLADVDPAGRA